ncbi:MAG: FAD-binding protein, partial [Marivivens sp.]|nr:FAD-binding protein [Marivivens sp.]
MDMPIPSAEILSRRADHIAALKSVVPADRVIEDVIGLRAYECDALTAYRCTPLAVVLPCNTEEVSAVLKLCHDRGIPVVPRGAGTSLAGGSLPTAD